ncbi:MAG: ATP-binding protein [Erythrobacter sp.]
MDHRRRFSAFVASGRDPRSTILEALEFSRDFLPSSSLDERSRIKVAIIVEELVSNSLRHGAGERDISLWLSLDDKGGAVKLEIEDDGEPFDPTSGRNNGMRFPGPDPQTGGGIGLAIVHAWGEDIAYTRSGGRNLLRMMIR